MTKRRVMKEFRLDEISAVDEPAQTPARIAIMKRDAKDTTSPSALMAGDGNPDSSGDSADTVGKQAAKEDPTMPDSKADNLSADIAKRDQEITYLKGVVGLNTDQRAYFDTLSADSKVEFIAKSASDRAAEIEAFEKANEVVYTSKSDGAVYRKNDDARLVAMAKRQDEREAEVETLRKASEDAIFSKRASDLIGLIPGKDEAKVALVKSISGLETEQMAEVEEILKAANGIYASALGTLGSTDTVAKANTGSLGPAELLEKAVEACAKEDGIAKSAARQKVMGTVQGQQLYEQARLARLAAS